MKSLSLVLAVSLVVLALAVDVAVAALAILRIALSLTAILRVVALLAAIVSLLVLRAAVASCSWYKCLAGLEGGSSRREGRGARAEAALRLALGLVAQVHLLGLLGQVLFLGRRVVFP